jgi:ABC-type polysaccharide/polyol phosphate transport system ATPase subunit
MKTAIVAREVTKVFSTYSHYRDGFKAIVLKPHRLFRARDRDGRVAVDHVSFVIHQGETFGIIGRNGAGKSTILALIGGILRPTSGEISVVGRISPLLALGVGFSYDLTGRENIILNGVLLGLRKKQIERVMNDIIEFSGLATSIDQPLKIYSSGMQMRLGFSIAVHVDPEILLIDEVLAVGDADFQRQCLDRIAHLRSQGVTIVFVSHDLQTVQKICDQAAYVENGSLITLGPPTEVIEAYRRNTAASSPRPRNASAR